MPPTNSFRLSGASPAFSTPISPARLMSSGITLSSRRRRSPESLSLMAPAFPSIDRSDPSRSRTQLGPLGARAEHFAHDERHRLRPTPDRRRPPPQAQHRSAGGAPLPARADPSRGSL